MRFKSVNFISDAANAIKIKSIL